MGHETGTTATAWVRDSGFSSRALADLGRRRRGRRVPGVHHALGRGPPPRIYRSCTGSPASAVCAATWLEGLDGYRGSPARCNLATAPAEQTQLDAYGELVQPDLAVASPRTLAERRRLAVPRVADRPRRRALVRARLRNLGMARASPEHFVHSKVLCWSALDGGIRLADECMRRAPVRRWKRGARRGARGHRAKRLRLSSAASTCRRSVAPRWTRHCCCCRPWSTSTGTTSGWCANDRGRPRGARRR